MGGVDTATKDMMRQNNYFADAVNLAVFHGKAYVKPEDLREIDTTEIATLVNINDNHRKKDLLQKYRDVQKEIMIKYDDKVVYFLVGVENQEAIHYAMPVKCMLYDAAQYAKQVDETAYRHRNSDKKRKVTEGEFLSGFYRDDKLKPIVTIVIYYGNDKWDAPRSIHEMFDDDIPQEVLDVTSDYRYGLIEPNSLDGDMLEKMYSDLILVLGFIKRANDKDALRDFVKGDEAFQHLDRKAAIVLKETTGVKVNVPKQKGDVNMCKAWEDAIRESHVKGEENMLNVLNRIYKEFIDAGKLQEAQNFMTDFEFQKKILADHGFRA